MIVTSSHYDLLLLAEADLLHGIPSDKDETDVPSLALQD